MLILTKGRFIMMNILSCEGFLQVEGISGIASITSLLVTLIKIGVPIILVIFGMLDMGKAVMAQKEDEIKKGQQTLIKRCIAAAIVFFVVTIVELVVGLLLRGNDEKDNIMECFHCFISNKDC